MTKKEKQYLQEEEASAYLYYVENKECFGIDHPHTLSALGRWGMVNTILDGLNVEANPQHPNNKKAFEIQFESQLRLNKGITLSRYHSYIQV